MNNANNSIINMEESDLKQLMEVVKETVATELNLQNQFKQSVFSAADLWKIQKMKKGITPRKTFIL